MSGYSGQSRFWTNWFNSALVFTSIRLFAGFDSNASRRFYRLALVFATLSKSSVFSPGCFVFWFRRAFPSAAFGRRGSYCVDFHSLSVFSAGRKPSDPSPLKNAGTAPRSLKRLHRSIPASSPGPPIVAGHHHQLTGGYNAVFLTCGPPGSSSGGFFASQWPGIPPPTSPVGRTDTLSPSSTGLQPVLFSGRPPRALSGSPRDSIPNPIQTTH